MRLDEAQRILEHADAGTIDLGDDEIRSVVEDANARVTRAMLWGGEEPARRRTVQVLVATGLFVAVGVIGLIIPLVIAASSR